MAFKVVNVTPIGESEYAREVLGKVGAEYIEQWCMTEDLSLIHI